MSSGSLTAKIKNVKKYVRMYQIPKTMHVMIAWNILRSSKEHLEISNLNIQLTRILSGGLDYYTKTVYEITHSAMGARDTICAGGRYDNLVSDIGGPATGAVGFAAGMEASMIALLKTRAESQRPEHDTSPLAPDVYIVSIGAESRNY